jgi:tetratricopeptide (TPR) repeat protein
MILGVLVQIALICPMVVAETKAVTVGRVGCPECVNDGSPIAQSLQRVDELYASFKTKEAQSELLKVLQLDPQNAEALSKMARVYIDFGDMIPESSPDWQEKRLKEYRTAEEYARKAVTANPNSTWGHFYVAAALGNIASLSSVDKQIDLAGEIRGSIEKAISLDPRNGFAYHAYGVWHRKLAEIGKMSRMLASFFYHRTIPQGSLAKSIDYLQKAVSLNPTVVVSRLELARTYVAMENWVQAQDLLKSVQNLPIQFSDDKQNKQKALRLLEEIKNR